MTLYIAAIPADAEAAARYGFPVAHMAYRLGNGGLVRARIPKSKPNDLMVLDDKTGPPFHDSAYVEGVVREIEEKRYAGLLADFERPPNAYTDALLSALSARVPVMYNVQSLVPCSGGRPAARYGRHLAAEIIKPANARDLADTVQTLEQLGYAAAFLLYPEAAGMLEELVSLL
jgi:hypothetical protein